MAHPALTSTAILGGLLARPRPREAIAVGTRVLYVRLVHLNGLLNQCRPVEVRRLCRWRLPNPPEAEFGMLSNRHAVGVRREAEPDLGITRGQLIRQQIHDRTEDLIFTDSNDPVSSDTSNMLPPGLLVGPITVNGWALIMSVPAYDQSPKFVPTKDRVKLVRMPDVGVPCAPRRQRDFTRD